MKTLKKTIAVILAFFMLTMFSNCSKSDPGSSSDTYVPDLSTPPLTWRNVADATNDFFFSGAPAPGTASGSFKAESFAGAILGHANCTFDHSSVIFIFDSGTYNGRTFTGKINGSASPVTITLSAPASGANPAVSFTLKKV
ncbi:MAG: hypothetical protein ABJA37_10655 [Ferruginibacter sp.]